MTFSKFIIFHTYLQYNFTIANVKSQTFVFILLTRTNDCDKLKMKEGNNMKELIKNFNKIGVVIFFYIVIIIMALLVNKRFQKLNKEEINHQIVWQNK